MHIKTKIAGVLMFAVLIMPGVSFAQTKSVADLQTLIASLMAQVQQLQAQLAAQTGGSTSWCYTFNTNLSVGMSGSAVSALQTALQKDGEAVTVSGTFDDQTAAAVTGFQEKYASTILAPYNLSNGTGYAGSGTRAKLNSLFGCTDNNPITPPIIVVNPVVPVSPSPVACSMLVPYCPYGGHSVVESNGCSQTVCNAAPVTSSAAPYISRIDPVSTLTPGGAVTLDGTGFDSGSYVDLDGVQSINPGAYASTYFDFILPSNISIGSHTIWIGEKASNVVSNQIVFNVSAATSVPTVTASLNPATIIDGQSTTLTWSSTGATGCTLSGNHAATDNGAWTKYYLSASGSQQITPYPTASATYTAQYQMTCTGAGGTNNPVSAYLTVNPPAGGTPVLSITNVSGVQSSYQPGQSISFTVSGVQLPSGQPATSASGFNVQAYVGLPGAASYLNGVNGSYNSALGAWQVIIPAPSTPGVYNLSAILYCGMTNGACAAQYNTPSSQVTKIVSFTVSATVQAPVINSFSVNTNQQFSLSAQNYSTITFQAQCGSFVDAVRSPDGTSVNYPTGSASLCNAPQYYSKSNTNADPSTPAMVNVPLNLYNSQGVVDGSTSWIMNPAGSNNDGSAMLTVNVCNTAGQCVQQSASFPIYAKACLATGTKISMADGSYKNIENVKIGDVVKSSNGKIVTSDMVTKVVQREDPIITINGKLEAAPDEVIYLASGETEAANLIKIGDQLSSEGGQAVTVTTVAQSNKLATTYDLSLKNGNTFFADGYLVQALNATE